MDNLSCMNPVKVSVRLLISAECKSKLDFPELRQCKANILTINVFSSDLGFHGENIIYLLSTEYLRLEFGKLFKVQLRLFYTYPYYRSF